MSIQSKVTLLSMVIIIAAVSLSAVIANLLLHQSIAAEVELQQKSIASLQANHINDQVQQRLNGLRITASRISPNMLKDPQALHVFLKERLILNTLFNGGIGIVVPDGTLIASMQADGARLGVNFLDREHIRTALTDGNERISHPIMAKVQSFPLISMVVPIRAPDGSVIGVLVGGVDLAKSNFFDDITDYAYGRTGYFLLIDRQSRQIITSTNKQRVMTMQEDAEVPHLLGAQPSSAATAITTNPAGIKVLATTAGIPAADWFILAALPTAEAFAPIQAIHDVFILAIGIIMLTAGGLVWWIMRGLLAPITASLNVVTALAEDPSQDLTLPIHRQDEIGQLSKGFNRLLERLRQQDLILRESEFRWKFAIEATTDGLWDWNVQDDTIYFSKTWKSMLGFEEHEISNRQNEWQSRVHPDDLEATQAAFALHLEGKTPFYSNEHRLRCKDGSYKWILDRGMVVSRDADNKPLRMIGTHLDIDVRRQMEEQIRELALQDPLTKLPNRRLLKLRLEHSILRNKRDSDHSALLFLDLDNFKPINDNHGHDAGDLLLMDVANRIKDCVRETDTVTRMGGDEFVILLEHLDKDEAKAQADAIGVAENIRARIAEPFVIELQNADSQLASITHSCTASIGVTVFGEAENQEKVLKTADDAMYDAKENGRNQVRFRRLLKQ